MRRSELSSCGASSKLPPTQIRARVLCSVPGETSRSAACSACHSRTSDELAELFAAAAAGPAARSPDCPAATADCSDLALDEGMASASRVSAPPMQPSVARAPRPPSRRAWLLRLVLSGSSAPRASAASATET
eukprot:scaffold29112_cov76-Phaeocystis_antarctica.AAC.1